MDFGDVNSDFTMCDLINPHPKRTRKLFSLIADYTNFYRVAAQVFEKTSSEYDHARLAIEEGMEKRLVKLGEEEEKSHRRALEVFSTRLEDLRMRKEDLISIMDSLRKNAPTIRDESVQLRNEMVRLRNERTEETELARRYCLELRSRFFDLLEKYHKAEKIFDAQAKAFSETIQNISMGLDDIEIAAGDNSSLSD
ncbi:hypothetical protein TELCIR_21407 [Teladorsagia circumcincta]|uniref:Kinetochore protein Nuf2 N-terminal domain-containing protein n=1 Tax=Teladorsagia circumcincta TaxID=45464 RepID=A0A2G9TGS5_TELCI|nr:hypothetical protein TELCIR_21407 [Teladorsagia circumcincta]